MRNKVLVFIDWYLPGFKSGGPVTSVSNLTGQLEKESDFFIITRNRDYRDEKPYADVQYDCWTTLGKNVKVFYCSDRLKPSDISHAVEGLSFNVWYITGIYSWYFSILPLLLSGRYHPGKVIVASRGMLSSHALGVKAFKKRMFLAFVKMTGLYSSAIFHATSMQEKKDIGRIFPRNEIVLVPNLARPFSEEPPAIVNKEPGVLRLFSISRISAEKNIKGAVQMLKALSADLPERDCRLEFDIFGQVNSLVYLEECKALAEELPPAVKIRFRGALDPSRLKEAVRDAHFLFFPSFGENFGHAILESLSEGKPVIISDRTPWREVEEMNCGWEISPFDTKRNVEVLSQCLEIDQDQYDEMCRASYAYARKISADENTVSAYKKLFAA